MSDRPRRSTRQAARPVPVASTSSPSRPKRVSQPIEPAEQLRILLESPKSILTKVDVADVFNLAAWEMLSAESRAALAKLLPPTAFVDYTPSLDASHPASSDMMVIDTDPNASRPVNPSAIFNNPHFLAAAQTFQDHLFSGWLSPPHLEKVQVFQKRIEEGSLAAPWKDEVWLEENAETTQALSSASSTTLAGFVESSSLFRPAKKLLTRVFDLHRMSSHGVSRGAAQIKLTTLVKEGTIQEGDILAYRRTFTTLNITVEKDAIIHSIDPKTHSLTVLTEGGTAKDVPSYLLDSLPQNPSLPTKLTNITSPSTLETGLLDTDGRVEKSARPNGNAWKAITVWRRRTGVDAIPGDKRGGRENHGTLFYLRSVYYNEH
ncbi:hypothetical protein CC1G_12333 [Coprinopsis cinerea okayama7|uniref:ASX DEUBAD domain-containing protein n=1 Tax=Coprinopsis cinerea (strain Okayama-7 / 130 / ATCC MYA-4618 / FGSC 9003) TaxID=240176 RepID=A8P2Q8_COPC7|nr:hypothetical protein CC1G_12333 [Coprinopsis cinerea okayama7\|eukprot:XP_001838383.1 hypothetical protein CC1G_12333 [Coprinopsis cinerea okayama7\